MDLTPLIPIMAIIAFAAVKIARINARPPESLSGGANARIDALEQDVQGAAAG